MVVSFSSANLPHPSSSPCGADVSSILTSPKATYTRKHHLGPCFSCAWCVSVWYVCRKSTMCISGCNCVCVIYMYKCIFIHLCVSVCCWMCVLLVMERVRGSGWCCGQTVRHTCVCVFYFLRSPLVCVCVRVVCLHPPHLDRNSQMSFAIGRWDPLENRIHIVPKQHLLYWFYSCSPIPHSVLFALVSLACKP